MQSVTHFSSAVLFPGLAPPTLFSIHYVKTRVEEKKKKIIVCVSVLVALSPTLFFSLVRAHSAYLCVSVRLHHLRHDGHPYMGYWEGGLSAHPGTA